VVKQNVDGSVGRHGVRRGSPVGCDRGKVDCVFRDPRPHLLQFQRLCRRILYPWARDVAGESDLQALLDVCANGAPLLAGLLQSSAGQACMVLPLGSLASFRVVDLRRSCHALRGEMLWCKRTIHPAATSCVYVGCWLD